MPPRISISSFVLVLVVFTLVLSNILYISLLSRSNNNQSNTKNHHNNHNNNYPPSVSVYRDYDPFLPTTHQQLQRDSSDDFPHKLLVYYKMAGCLKVSPIGPNHNSMEEIMKGIGANFVRAELKGWWDTTWYCEKGRSRSLDFNALAPKQTVNVFPNIVTGRVDKGDFCAQMISHWGREEVKRFSFDCYSIPEDRSLFEEVVTSAEAEDVVWVVKPRTLSGGKGISVLRNNDVLNYITDGPQKKFAIQRYLLYPDLLRGFKFDTRVYVFVPSLSPLRIYIHERGFVRRAYTKYEDPLKNLDVKAMHITNISYQEHLVEFERPRGSFDDHGNGTWSFEALMKYHFGGEEGANKAWEDIRRVISQILIAFTAPLVEPYCRGCYELYGFDVIFDSDVNPHIIEVNRNPVQELGEKADVLNDVFRSKGINPRDWPLRHDVLLEYLDFLELEISNPIALQELEGMLTEYYRRGRFHLAWPFVETTETGIKLVTPLEYSHPYADVVYNAFETIINNSDQCPLSVLFARIPSPHFPVH